MLNTFMGISTITTGSAFDLDYIICAVMIAVGFLMMKKCRRKRLCTVGRIILAVGTGLLVWMLLWQITPTIMAQLIYGMRI